MRVAALLMALVLVAGLGACNTSHNVKLEPVEVKPIHITIDVNVRVDRALDDFFGDIDDTREELVEETPATP